MLGQHQVDANQPGRHPERIDLDPAISTVDATVPTRAAHGIFPRGKDRDSGDAG
jgi:hypothetical protein